jgi:glycerol-1-phosphate dehydrogenase [NAD(P)+]
MSRERTETGSEIQIPESLEELMGFSARCPCGRTHSVEMRGASVRKGAIEDLLDWVLEIGCGLNVLVVVDQRTRQIAGERVLSLLLRGGHRARFCVVPDGTGGRPHAEESNLSLVEKEMEGADAAVAVGSGTINDLAKLSSYRKRIPYVSVATAPSMNGYTSAIAAVMLQGVKKTVDCHQPLAVIVDLDIIQSAPRELIAAGLGDLESKPTATADFRLAGMVRGEYHCKAPERVVLQAEAKVADAAKAIGGGDPEALALLSRALLLSGISMKLAGSSSPASGGEHLISHFWDMTAEEEGRVEGWHGAQVGVATLVTAALYEELREVSPDAMDAEALVRSQRTPEDADREIRLRHGPRADEVLAEYHKKALNGDSLMREIEAIRSRWSELWSSLDGVLRPLSRIQSILKDGGAPTTMSELRLTPDHLRRSFLAAREIRGRYTVLDFAAELGLLEPLCERVIRKSGCIG